MFGVRQKPNGEWAPILEREETNPCKKCRGYGTYGNPLCGAVYTCTDCNGTGQSSNHEPEPTVEPAAPSKPEDKSYSQRILSFFGLA